MFSKEAPYAKSCKVVHVLAGTDHPALTRAPGGCRGPPQPPEQELRMPTAQAACPQLRACLAWLQGTSTRAGGLSAPPHVMGDMTDLQLRADICKL